MKTFERIFILFLILYGLGSILPLLHSESREMQAIAGALACLFVIAMFGMLYVIEKEAE